MQEWLFYQIYPGRTENIDMLLREVVAPAVQEALALGVVHWFFLRFIDERGVHVRLRFKGAPDVVSAIQRRVDRLAADRLPMVASQTLPPLKGLLPWSPGPLAPGHIGVELGMYEPEYEKYGGAAGVAIAERLFQVSSEVALNALQAEASAMDGRATLALLLMEAGLQEGLLPQEWPVFLDDYAWFWLGGRNADNDRRRASLEEAATRRGEVVRQRCQRMLETGSAAERVAAYRAALHTALADAGQQHLPVRAMDLTFHYLHLMNNRLGIIPWDEAYLARLVAHWQQLAQT